MNAQPPIPQGYMKNRQGDLKVLSSIKPQDLLEDELVGKMIAEARDLRTRLRDFKAGALAEVSDFRDLVMQEYGAMKGGAKGNMTLSTFDGSAEVQVQVSESISFGPELSAAKELIDDCITRWSEGANDNLRAIVDQAFQINKVGRIDTHRVLGLRKLAITAPGGGKDAEWERAMEAISDAVRVTGSKTYLRFYETDEKGARVAVSLDLAVL